MAIFETASETETVALASKLASLANTHDVFLLEGPLGAGKSVFARGFIRTLCGDIEVPSPTFTLVQTYESEKGPLWHFDLYRLEHPDEIYEIGWEDALSSGIILLEWPQRLGMHMPPHAKRIRIETLAGESRRITIDE